jgi:ATP-dependent DNA ligase
MKAYPFEEKRLNKWKPPYIVQPKYDGVRCRAIPLSAGGYMLLSSEENVFFSVPHINEALNKTEVNIELDGELYSHPLYLEGGFELISSITSRTVNLHPRHEDMQFHIFDIVDDMQQQMKRTLRLRNLPWILPFGGPLVTSPFWVCDTLEQIMKIYDDFMEIGYEGIIVRHINAFYERKRSTWMMKFKPKKEDIYEIKGFSEELSIEGDLKDTLGRIICASGDIDVPWLGLYPAHTKPPEGYFGVGSGFSDEKRKSIWSYPYYLEGKSTKVKYQHLTSGKKVPRFPVFVEVIEDVSNSKN